MNSPNLDQLHVSTLNGVGAQISSKLSKIGIYTIQDLVFHLPLRYIDRTQISPIGTLKADQEVAIEGEIIGSEVIYGRRRSLLCRLEDITGAINLRFFHFNSSLQRCLKKNTFLRCYGQTKIGSSGIEIYHPEYQFINPDKPTSLQEYLTAVYPTTQGISQQRMRNIVLQALALIDTGKLEELLPNILQKLPLKDELKFVHQPPSDTPIEKLIRGEHRAQQRLAFEELLAHNLSLLKLRQSIQQRGGPILKVNNILHKRFLNSLPFMLTTAQNRVSLEIQNDLNSSTPMLRLLQGDVGSGKTVVAAIAALQCIANGKQCALMAPTEILAEQHFSSFKDWLNPLGVKLGWLSGKMKSKARIQQLDSIEDGSAQIVIGTHALFQEEVCFHNLALTIIDEQHRFGVHQRLALQEKRRSGNQVPHQLIMTATPIPRTLAMTIYANLDVSVIDKSPPGRLPVNTVVMLDRHRKRVIDRIQHACANGCQAYWICTLIEESDILEAQAAEVTAKELHLLLPKLKIGLVHGRQKPDEKSTTIAAFKSGEIQLLVATTVVEVGVDVPNASLMIIENPERLGLAQLHQLRGRVGRGKKESHCVLLYSPPLSRNSSERLKVMRQTNDGFKIAEMDLKLRGAGEVLGTKQTGEMAFRIADLNRDAHLISEVQKIAQLLLSEYPSNVELLIQRWLGSDEQYGQV
jgi:ATP-dependent DNA helicase RecG